VSELCITGVGVISAIGNNLAENFNSLCHGKSGISKVNYLNTVHRDFLTGEVKASDTELKLIAGLDTETSIDRTTLLGIIAAKEALEMSGIKDNNKIGFISSTTVAGMCYTELQYPHFLAKNDYPNFIKTHECAASTFAIAKRLGLKGFTDTISTACSSSANAIMEACNLIKNDICDVVMAGGTDAMSLFTLNGFNTLMILDKEWCRPFDQSRAGLNLGEGAAYLVIEKKEHAIERGAQILANISGYSNYNDAFHQTASSPEGKGAFMAMEGAMKMAAINPEDIDYINAHGTATPNNDLSESTAIHTIFGNNWPLFSSTKAFTGHTLAACGAIEAAFSVLSLQHNLLFPNLNFKTPIKDFEKHPITTLTQKDKITNILSNSFGFGGNCSSLIISRNQ
jgi:3-oxoacyl-[acyl-carrier-protein] synthase II